MLYPEKQWNNLRACWTVGETVDHLIEIIPMIYNHRVVMSPMADLQGYVVGWCYPTMEAAEEAVLTWNPPEAWQCDPDLPGFRPAGFMKETPF